MITCVNLYSSPNKKHFVKSSYSESYLIETSSGTILVENNAFVNKAISNATLHTLVKTSTEQRKPEKILSLLAEKYNQKPEESVKNVPIIPL